MSDSNELEDLIARSDATQLNFLRTELDVCQTLAALTGIRLEVGDSGGFSQARQNAEAAYETAARFVSNVRNLAHQEEIQHGLRQLRVVLDRLVAC